MSFDVLATFGAVIGPLGTMAWIILRMKDKRIQELEDDNRELLGLLWEMAGDTKIARTEIRRVLTKRRGDEEL